MPSGLLPSALGTIEAAIEHADGVIIAQIGGRRDIAQAALEAVVETHGLEPEGLMAVDVEGRDALDALRATRVAVDDAGDANDRRLRDRGSRWSRPPLTTRISDGATSSPNPRGFFDFIGVACLAVHSCPGCAASRRFRRAPRRISHSLAEQVARNA